LWIVQQLREAFPFESAPRFVIFDRDAKYGLEVPAAVRSLSVNPIRTSRGGFMKKLLAISALMIFSSGLALAQSPSRKQGTIPLHATMNRTAIGPGLAC
jgi:hypothetical protein